MTPSLTSVYLLRVLTWHSLLLLLLLIGSQIMRTLEPGALLLGGVFMGLNFGLLWCFSVWNWTASRSSSAYLPYSSPALSVRFPPGPRLVQLR